LLIKNTRVLDVGCGAGWFANSIKYYYKSDVTGIDFNPVAISRAEEVARLLKIDTNFILIDLFKYSPEDLYDLVTSLGVLHHTNDAMEGLRYLCRNCLKSGGYIFIGLYHKYGRRPFLQYFEKLKKQGCSEDTLLERYKEIHSNLSDNYHLYSWFRDQVLNPHETLHTLQEVTEVLRDENMKLISTSINRFDSFDSLDELFEKEKSLELEGEKALKSRRYYPGFFVFLAKKIP